MLANILWIRAIYSEDVLVKKVVVFGKTTASNLNLKFVRWYVRQTWCHLANKIRMKYFAFKKTFNGHIGFVSVEYMPIPNELVNLFILFHYL